MKRPPPFALMLALLVCAPDPARAQGWKSGTPPPPPPTGWEPITPADLAIQTPTVDPQADAEALFWEIRIDDEFAGGTVETDIRHYVRLKIFTEQGKQNQSKIDLPYARGTAMADIAARTIAADGRIVELAKKDIFQRTIVKGDGVRVNARSFVPPAVEVGSILEYRWREHRTSDLGLTGNYSLQLTVPCRRVTYRVKPVQFEGGMLRYTSFNTIPTPFEPDQRGYQTVTVTNVPAFVEEPDMPPELEVKRWIMIHYGIANEPSTPDEYWNDAAREYTETDRAVASDGKKLQKQAAEVAGDAATPEEKLRRLFEFCRGLRNLDDDATSDDDSSPARHKNAARTFELREGTSADINRLFAALASGLGFPARMARLPSRGTSFFRRQAMKSGFLTGISVAVRVGDGWRFYDPGSMYVAHGMLMWFEEDQPALLLEKNAALWVDTPLSPSDSSRVERSGSFRLLADGALEGEGRIAWTGHLAVSEKEGMDELEDKAREEQFRDEIAERIPGAVVSDVRFEHVGDLVQPMSASFKLRVPGYAKATGRRLFFRPGLFQSGVPPRFATSARRHPVYFHHPWLERDSVVIALPEGYELEDPESPPNHKVGDAFDYQVQIGTRDAERAVVYRRSFRAEGLLYPTDVYRSLKKAFDGFHERDQHELGLRQVQAGAAQSR